MCSDRWTLLSKRKKCYQKKKKVRTEKSPVTTGIKKKDEENMGKKVVMNEREGSSD